MKRQLLLRCLLLATTACLSACAGSGTSKQKANLTSLTLEKPVIAVMPFETEDLQDLDPEFRKVREFEKSYFAARMVMALRGVSNFGGAYFSEGPTPSADYTIKGTISESNGLRTSVDVTVLGADGEEIDSFSEDVEVSAQENASHADAAGRIWTELAKHVAEIRQEPGDFAVARVHGYAPKAEASDARARMAREAADVERRGLLVGVTDELVKKAQVSTSLYMQWQKTSAPLIEQRDAASSAKGWNTAAMIMGGVATGMSAYSQNTSLMTQSMGVMTHAANQIDVQNAKIGEIDKTLAVAAQGMSMHRGRPTSVVLFGKTYQLSGSLHGQQTELHRIVEQKIGEAEGPPPKPAKGSKKKKS